MTRSTLSIPILTVSLFLSIIAPSVMGMNPDLALTDAERDSLLAEYDNIFPILGRKALEQGFDLPRPLGISVNLMPMHQDMLIENLRLSVGDNPLQEIDFVEFGDIKSKITTGNVRLDLWVLPFLNLNSMLGVGRSNIKVDLVAPIEFTSDVTQTGAYYGFGFTTALGIRRNWLSFDMNWTWTDLEKLEERVMARVLGVRYGRTFKLDKKKRLAVWVGGMKQSLDLETLGSIKLTEALPPEALQRLENYDSQPWYLDLGPVARGQVDSIVARIQDGKVNYGIEKRPKDPWNMIIGANLELGKPWAIRSEVGLIGRFSLLIAANYRLNL
jgi:hypothetical protein